MSTRTITISPITRLEGHGKIEIFLNEEGNVENAYFQVPELRGFERFCEGRKAEDLPIITSRICGVCPVAHHFASTKALDAAFNVDPPSAAKKLRELMYSGYMVYDHTLHFYFLGAPDFVVGPDAPAGESAASFEEFLDKIKEIDIKSLEFHLYRGDFEKWIAETLEDKELAEEIMNLRDITPTRDVLRNQLVIIVSRRHEKLLIEVI